MRQRGLGGDRLAHPEAGEAERSGPPLRTARIRPVQCIGEGDDAFDLLEFPGLREAPQAPRYGPEDGEVRDGIRNERERPSPEGLPQEGGVDVGDPVGEALLRPGAPVVKLVWEKDVDLPAPAVPACPAIEEGLHAAKRDADGVGVVTVEGEGRTREGGRETFDPGAAPGDRDAAQAVEQALRAPARSFQTRPVRSIYRLPRGRLRRGAAGLAQVSVDHGGALFVLILTGLAVMGSPGPSTVSMTAVAAAYGARRALRHFLGLVAGTTIVLLAVAGGLVSLLLSAPGAAPVLLAASTGYLCWLAFRIATAPPLSKAGRPVGVPSFAGAFLLAVGNPKAYVAIAAVYAMPLGLASPAADAIAKLAVLSVLVVAIHAAWLLAGGLLSRLLTDPTASRRFNLLSASALVLAVLAAVLA
ncbi:MAG TPA: LysE family translocator [Beijerinckiaceae bacterium]|nr:LysE family translocator [Beijerinckiaceae bacterium]